MITISTSPDDISSVNRSVIWELQSNRYQPNATIKTFASTDISSGGAGFTNIFITAHGYFNNDVIQITGNTNYNGKYSVIVVDANNFKIVKAFITTTQSGNAQLINGNFQITAEITTYNKNRLNILSASASGDSTRFTTSTSHNYNVGDRIFIEGTTNYNGFHLINFIASTTVFQVEISFVSSQAGTVIKGEKLGSKIAKGINENGVDLFRFDVSNFLRAAVSFNLSELNTTSIQSPNDAVIATYQILFKEAWEGADGLMLSVVSQLFTTEKRVINSTLQHREIQNMNAFTVSSSAKRFLTNLPVSQSFNPNTDNIQLSFIHSINEIIKVKTDFTDSANNITTSPSEFQILIKGRHGIVPINKIQLANGLPDTIPRPVSETPLGAAIRVSSFITVELRKTDNTIISEKIKLLIDKNNHCDSIRLWWQNRLSGMDPYTFTGRVEKKQKSKKELFKKLLQKGFSIRDRGMGVLSTENIINYEVHSEFLSPEQMTWLSELISSPEVFMQEGTNLIPIIITDSDEVIQDTEELRQFKIKFIEANELISQ